jgi:FkbH-like protein
MRFVDLYWLPPSTSLNDELRRLSSEKHVTWAELARLANTRMDFVQTKRLDKIRERAAISRDGEDAPARSLRMAVLSSSTADHLLPSIRVSALRRNVHLQTFSSHYGTYLRDLQDETSPLFEFNPEVILFAFHAPHLLGSPHPGMDRAAADALIDSAAERVCSAWRRARECFGGQILQQSVLPVSYPLIGMNERRLPGSAADLTARLNRRLAELSGERGVDILSLEPSIVRDGLHAWHDPVLWLRAKAEISPAAAPAYGELVGRLIAAQQGRSAKCLVLDLDNTLWGGVVGDDGLEGIRLGQGSAIGEAYVDFQTYARDLGRRGVILAVCSKNDLEQARLPFERHPDMVLKLEDIACFVANWSDKAANLRAIADELEIGIDSLVFIDDNPFERNIVRRELPTVLVPEVPDDPAFYAQCIADAGYFEALHVTAEDFERGGHYRANVARENLRASQTNIEGYLASLEMELRWRPFDAVGLQRIVQLINKTNQFNLTTRRYTMSQVASIMRTPGVLTLQLRLVDKFGDNGVIGIVIGKPDGDSIVLDVWLMSCRVLGRQVEQATMNLVAAEARRLGALQLIGDYLPTKKNDMVREHYCKLGFVCTAPNIAGASRWTLNLADYQPFETSILVVGSDA